MQVTAAGPVTGTGVTIVNNGSVDMSGAASITLAAPTVATATLGAVPGVLFANNVNLTGTSSITGSISGSAAAKLSGVLYFPKSNISISGAGFSAGSGNLCLEIVANFVTISGSGSMTNSGCPAMGVATIGSGGTVTPGSAKLLY